MRKHLIKWAHLLLVLYASPILGARSELPFQQEESTVLNLDFRGPITNASFDHLNRALTHARIHGNPALLLELNSIGGFASSVREIVPLILSSDIPVLIWITGEKGQAASSALFVALSAHLLFMQPNTGLGDRPDNRDLSESRTLKLEAEARAYLKTISKKRNRRGEWIQTFLRQGEFFSAQKAFEQKMIDGIASTKEEIWKMARDRFLDLPEEVRFQNFDKNLPERIQAKLSNPDVSLGLLTIGAIGLFIELTKPGLVIAGGMGSLAIAASVLSMNLVPIRPSSIWIFLIGLLIIAIEVLTPFNTFGVAAFMGAACLLYSGIFLVNKAQSDIVLDANIWIPLFATMLIVMLIMTGISIWRRRMNPLGESMVRVLNKTGTIQAVINGDNAIIEINGHRWAARWNSPSPELQFAEGLQVRVVEQRGFILHVEK